MDALGQVAEARHLFLSSPCDLGAYDSAVVRMSKHKPYQCLFGYDAQLRIFGKEASRAGFDISFLPAPELFYSDISRRYLTKGRSNLAAFPHEPVHLRFGMVRTARVLKRAHNIHVLAADNLQVPTNFGKHPFAGDGRQLPASVSSILAYGPVLNPPNARGGGTPLRITLLPPAFWLADLPGEADHSDQERYGATQPGSLKIQSFREFSEDDWVKTGPDPLSIRTLDFRRWLIDRQESARDCGDKLRRLVVVPWNLSHASSIVPHVLLHLCRRRETADATCQVAVMPYNITPAGLNRFVKHIKDCQSILASRPSLASQMFVARFVSLADIWSAIDLFGPAWLDGSDPEWRWNLKRLTALGLPSLLIDVDHDMQREESLPELHRVKADVVEIVRVQTGYGEFACSVRTVSSRAMEQLIASTRELGALYHYRVLRDETGTAAEPWIPDEFPLGVV